MALALPESQSKSNAAKIAAAATKCCSKPSALSSAVQSELVRWNQVRKKAPAPARSRRRRTSMWSMTSSQRTRMALLCSLETSTARTRDCILSVNKSKDSVSLSLSLLGDAKSSSASRSSATSSEPPFTCIKPDLRLGEKSPRSLFLTWAKMWSSACSVDVLGTSPKPPAGQISPLGFKYSRSME